MNELEERLNAVLSDPGELSRLTKMAQQLLGGEEETPAPEKEPPAGLPAGLTAALGALKGKGEPPLLQAVHMPRMHTSMIHPRLRSMFLCLA